MKFLKSLTKFSISLFLFLALISCQSEKVETKPSLTQNKGPISASKIHNIPLPKSGTIKLPSGESLRVRLAISMEEQTQGLSGIKDIEFENDEAMLWIEVD